MAAPREKPIIGIDLGTTNACVAHVRNRIPKVVPTDRGSLILPTVVALSERGDMLVGGIAKDQLVTNPTNTVYGAKRLIGRKWNSTVVQELRHSYSYDIVEGPGGEAAVLLGGEVRALPQVSALVLSHVKKIAEAFLGRRMDEAVISVPAYYNDNQRQAVKEAVRLAGFEVKRIVNEPTAAALAYGFARGLDQKVLVYDLGGGTFDVSVLQLSGNVFEVLATGGDTFLGGVDFDNRIIDFVLEGFWREHRIDLAQSPIAMQRVKKGAEAAKIDLSLIPNVAIDLPYIEEKRGKPLDVRMQLSRQQLDDLTHDLVERTFALCDQVLAERNIRPDEIDEIILVGGQSRMPLVQARIQEHFGRPARKGVHPDECVALGAARAGAADRDRHLPGRVGRHRRQRVPGLDPAPRRRDRPAHRLPARRGVPAQGELRRPEEGDDRDRARDEGHARAAAEGAGRGGEEARGGEGARARRRRRAARRPLRVAEARLNRADGKRWAAGSKWAARNLPIALTAPEAGDILRRLAAPGA